MERKNCISFQERQKDYLGNNRMVIDSAGNVLQRTDNDPFGMPFYEPSDTNNPACNNISTTGRNWTGCLAQTSLRSNLLSGKTTISSIIRRLPVLKK